MAYSPGGSPRNDLLTPPASSVASTVATPLPQPRRHPLKPGGPKESSLITYLDQHIMVANRRFAKRMFKDEDAGDVKGYHSFKEVAKDIDALVDLVWVSGTPNIQIPYLLNLALMVAEFLPCLPLSPRPTFHLLEKLDHAFASLLNGKDLDTGEHLPGFENGKTVSTTEKVRIMSAVKRTRLAVVQLMSDGDPEQEADEDETMDTDDDDEDMDDAGDDVEDEWDLDIGKVYERTIGELGDELTGPPIGIITDDPFPFNTVPGAPIGQR